MRRSGTITLAARVLTLLAAGALPFAAHPAAVTALLFLTPLISACACAAGWKHHGVLMTLTVCLCTWAAGLVEQVRCLACLWFAAALLMDMLPAFRQHRRAVLGWSVLTTAIVCVAVTMLRAYFGGAAIQGMADALADWLGGREDSNRLLLTLYQMGYARLEGDMAQTPAVQMFGRIIMNPETHRELVNSLRTTLKYLFNEQLPGWIATYLIVSALLTAVVPEGIRRRKGQATELPPVHKLYMDRKAAMGACMLMLCGLARFLTPSLAVCQASGMAMTAFTVLYSAQGVCLIVWWLRNGQYHRGGWLITAALLLFLLPMIGTLLLILGVADQFADPRKLREKDRKDIEGGT